jgi:hypothetical protein
MVTCPMGSSFSSSSSLTTKPMEGLHEVCLPPFFTKTFEDGGRPTQERVWWKTLQRNGRMGGRQME